MREITDFCRGWKMTAVNDATGADFRESLVNLPFIHSASAFTTIVFANSFTAGDRLEGEAVYIEFRQISGRVKVFCGNTCAGEHTGINSSFRIKLTDSAAAGQKFDLTVAVEPKARPDGYFIFGKVSVISVSRSHFALDDNACSGITLSAVRAENGAEIRIRARIANPNNYDVVSFTVEDENGALIASKTEKPTGADTVIELPEALLWGGQNETNLYTLKAALVRDITVLDNTELTFGIRDFSIGDDRFFRVNGLKLPLNGVSLADCSHLKTDRILLDMIDANSLTADTLPAKTDLLGECDRNGTLFWFDLPCTGELSDLDELRDFLGQNSHHPSFAFICCGSTDAEYLTKFREICAECAPGIFTAVKCDINETEKLPETLPDIVALTVDGKNGGDSFTAAIGRLETLKKTHPEASFALFARAPETEPGEDAISEEKLCVWHEKLWNAFCRERSVIGFFGGLLTDAKNGRGTGLVTADREYIKDVFWFYKSRFSADGFIKLCAAEKAKVDKKKIDIKCYTNTPPAELTVNGDGKKKYKGTEVYGGVYVFTKVALKKGENTVEAAAGGETDSTVINYEKK